MSRTITVWTALAMFVAALFGVGALGTSPAQAQGADDDPAQVEAGQAVFETACAGCHGADGMGSERGRPLTDIASQEPDRSVHIASVTDGRGSMPAFADILSAEEIDAAISYVRLTFVSAQDDAGADDAGADDEAAEDTAEELAETGVETPALAIAGVTLVVAGALTLGTVRRSRSH